MRLLTGGRPLARPPWRAAAGFLLRLAQARRPHRRRTEPPSAPPTSPSVPAATDAAGAAPLAGRRRPTPYRWRLRCRSAASAARRRPSAPARRCGDRRCGDVRFRVPFGRQRIGVRHRLRIELHHLAQVVGVVGGVRHRHIAGGDELGFVVFALQAEHQRQVLADARRVGCPTRPPGAASIPPCWARRSWHRRARGCSPRTADCGTASSAFSKSGMASL